MEKLKKMEKYSGEGKDAGKRSHPSALMALTEI